MKLKAVTEPKLDTPTDVPDEDTNPPMTGEFTLEEESKDVPNVESMIGDLVELVSADPTLPNHSKVLGKLKGALELIRS